MIKKCKCKIISFVNMNLYLLLIPLGAVFKAAKEILRSNSNKFSETDSNNQHPIIFNINNSFGLCFSFIPFTIYIVLNKRNKNANIFLFNKMAYNPSIYKKISKIEKFLWILLGSLFDFIANIIYAYNWLANEDYLTYWSTSIIFLSLFSFLLLKKKLYKHHYLSAVIIIVLGIVYNIINLYFDKDKIMQNYKGYIMYFIAESTFNSLYVFYKFLMVHKFIKSYTILFFQGLIELILGIISLAITTKYFKNIDNFYSYKEGLDNFEIFMFVGLILINIIFDFCGYCHFYESCIY